MLKFQSTIPARGALNGATFSYIRSDQGKGALTAFFRTPPFCPAKNGLPFARGPGGIGQHRAGDIGLNIAIILFSNRLLSAHTIRLDRFSPFLPGKEMEPVPVD